MPLVLAALLSIVPVETVVRDHVDLVERNAFYDEEGKHVFTQLIWWQNTPSGYRVREWRMVKDAEAMQPQQLASGEWQSLWLDRGEVLRDVRATTYEESFTQYDRELKNRELLPQEQRRGFNLRRAGCKPPEVPGS